MRVRNYPRTYGLIAVFVMGDDQDQDSGNGSSNSGGDAVVNIFLSIPNVNKDERQRCLQYDPDDTVWTVRQTLLASIKTELVESFNYGLFCPPSKGRAGKFLDEDRCMKDYGLTGSGSQLELKYKSRVYKELQPAMMRKDKLAHIQSPEVLLKLMSKVMKGQVDRVKKLTVKGVDPNFIDPESGETPLTYSVRLVDPKPIMLALVEGGAHLDFRNRQSFTALHCAALRCSQKAISALLELGSSTNYQDRLGLTPLYHCVLTKDAVTALECIDLLLYDHAATDVVDDKGWTPLHQVCRSGRVQILDKLIFYGADMNCLNGNGNTPLHICAINNQEECARLLLFRGAIKSVVNSSSVDAEFLASKAGNEKLMETFKNFLPKDVVPYSEQPKRNPRRRTSPWIGSNGTISRARTIADFGGLRSIGRQSSLQFNANPDAPHGGDAKRPVSSITISSTIQSSSTQQSSLERPRQGETGQQYLHQQATVVGAYDEYANLDNFAPPPSFATVPSSSAVTASTTQWKNSQTTEMKKAAAAAEKEEYENLDECLQRCHEGVAGQNQLGQTTNGSKSSTSQHRQSQPSTMSTFSSGNEQWKPVPPPASSKPKLTSGVETYDDIGSSSSDSSSIVSGTGSLSSSGSAVLVSSRPPMPQFGSSGDEHGFALDAENLRRDILRKKYNRASSDDGLGGSINSPTEGSSIYEPPPMPSWTPPPPQALNGASFESKSAVANAAENRQNLQQQSHQQLQSSSSSSNNARQGGAVNISDDGFKELLARKAEQRTVADPAEQRRNLSTVNSTGPFVTLRKTSTLRDNDYANIDTVSRPPPGTSGSRPPPPTKQKNARPTLTTSASVEQSTLSLSNRLSHAVVQPPSTAPPNATGPTFQRQATSNGSRWQTEVKKPPMNHSSSIDTTYSPVDIDDINSLILPPPPDDFLFNHPSSQSTSDASPPFYLPKSPEKFTTTTFRPPSLPNSPEMLSPPQSFKTHNNNNNNYNNNTNNAISVSRPNLLPVSSSTRPAIQVPPPPENFASNKQNAFAPKPAPTASFAKIPVAPKAVPTPPVSSFPRAFAAAKVDQPATDASSVGNIAPPVAFSEGTVTANRRREVAAAVATQWKSSTVAKPQATTGSSSGQSAMVDWSRDDVQRWLEGIQMSGHCDAFRTAGVDGRRLIAMTDDDLYYMGVREAGQRLMLARAIKTALAND